MIPLQEIMRELNQHVSGQFTFPPAEFFLQETEKVARELLGCLLLKLEDLPGGDFRVCGGRIVETEAYLGREDPACHAARGRTAITEIFYRPGGLAYVYLIYRMYDCLNVITGPAEQAGAVLFRAIEPLVGLGLMAERRKTKPGRIRDLCSGPGKLCRALAVDRRLNGLAFNQSPLLLLAPGEQDFIVNSGPRIGINKAADWPLRFWIDGSPFVSG